MSVLNERLEFFRTVAQGFAGALTAGKIVFEVVKNLAKRKAAQVALCDQLAEAQSEIVMLRAQVSALRIDLARTSVSWEREARAHKTLAARVRAEKDDGEEIDERANVTFLKEEPK